VPAQGLLQLPQWAAEVSVLVSQPLLQKSSSQSAVPLAQLGAAHTFAVQSSPPAQSEHFPQLAPEAHPVVQLPPQSTSVSSPFLTWSVHVGAQTPLAHDRPTQSASIAQPLPGPQSEHGPPQSTSVSSPFFAPSLHVAG
jgi:hypothetical protein